MAEVHIIGQIVEAREFPKKNLFCKWYLQTGNNWKLISGKKEGQTQVISSETSNICKWCFPLDFHLATTALKGWPKIYLQVYHLDWLGRSHIFGYGYVTVPTSPGTHNVDCYTWRPFGSIRERFVQFFLGGGYQIKNPDLIFSPGERYKLSTEAMGIVSFELCVVLSCKLQTTEHDTELKKNDPDSTAESTMTSIPITTCSVNGSSCFDNSTTTVLPIEHISNVNNHSTTSPIQVAKLEETSSSVSSSVKDICICDLTVDFCDLNCCCDKDCSSKDKRVFDHCEEDFHEYDTRFCQFTKRIYINKTLHEYQVNQDGLFCIVKNNLPPSYISQRKHPLQSIQEAEFQKNNKFSWPRHIPPKDQQFRPLNYSYGKALWVLRNHTLERFQIAGSFFADKCVIRKEVKYLIDVKNSCSHLEVSEENSNLNAETYFMNMTIIANPALFNLTSTKECPKNICIKAEPKICDDNFENCVQVTKNHQPFCHLSVTQNIFSCGNLVKCVKYDFYHNGTAGILKANVYVVLQNLSVTLGKSAEFSQDFEVNFIWWNHTLNFSSHLSGNPGYLVGKPILTADLVSFVTANNTNATNNTTHYIHQLKLLRNPSDFTNNFMVLSQITADGDCVLNSHKYMQIEFGFNLYTKCKLKEVVLHRNMSARNICAAIQKTIFSYWNLNVTNNTLSNKLIGQFGNAKVHYMPDWLHIMFRNDLQEILNYTWGEFDYKRKTLNCGNLSTLFLPEIYYSRVDFEDVPNQHKILGVVFNFDAFKNVSFSFDPKEKYLRFNVKISTQVTFFDVTTKKLRKVVDPPSLNIKLPHDFFYPFVKLDSGCNKELGALYLVSCCFIIIMANYLSSNNICCIRIFK